MITKSHRFHNKLMETLLIKIKFEFVHTNRENFVFEAELFYLVGVNLCQSVLSYQ